LLSSTAIENDEDIRALEDEISELSRCNATEESRLATLHADIAAMEQQIQKEDSEAAALVAAASAADHQLSSLRSTLVERLTPVCMPGLEQTTDLLSVASIDTYVTKLSATCRQNGNESAVYRAVSKALVGIELL
jgi:hypothetical protein